MRLRFELRGLKHAGEQRLRFVGFVCLLLLFPPSLMLLVSVFLAPGAVALITVFPFLDWALLVWYLGVLYLMFQPVVWREKHDPSQETTESRAGTKSVADQTGGAEGIGPS
jgi:hypothetical protein